MRIGPDEIDVDLPRALIGGLKRGPTEELLSRVAEDYAQLYHENNKLRAAMAQMEREAAERAELLRGQARQQEGPALETEPEAVVQPTPVQPEVALAMTTELRHAPRTPQESDELARVVLEVAQRAAREMRESARRECELMLKKAGSYARELERLKASKEAELEDLDGVKREMCDRMRVSLRAILPQLTASGAP